MIRQTVGIKAGSNGDVRDGGCRGQREGVKQDGLMLGKNRGKRSFRTRRETREQRRRRESDRQGNTSHSQEEKEGDTLKMEVAAGFGGRLYAVL